LDRTHTAYQPSTPKISSSITRRGTNPAEGSRGNSRVAPTTDSLAGAPISPASPSPERGERSPSQEWRQQLASSWFSPFGALRTPWLRPARLALEMPLQHHTPVARVKRHAIPATVRRASARCPFHALG